MSKKSKVDFSELEKFNKKLQKLSKSKNVPISDLFSKKFISKNTNFSNADDFFNACNINTDKDLKNIPDNELDELVSLHTNFNSWQDMLNASAIEYCKNQLEL